MGANQEHVSSISELKAFKRAKQSDITYVISIKTVVTNGLKDQLIGKALHEIPTTKNEEAKTSQRRKIKQSKVFKNHMIKVLKLD